MILLIITKLLFIACFLIIGATIAMMLLPLWIVEMGIKIIGKKMKL